MEEKPLGQALLICKDTGKQVKLNLADPIEPWPTPSPGGYVNDNPCTKLSGEFVIKSPWHPSYMLYERLVYGWTKLPRKMKKAFKHINRFRPVVVVEHKGEHHVLGGISFNTKDGYPYTKWVRKTIGKAAYREGLIPMVKTTLGKEIEDILKGETK